MTVCFLPFACRWPICDCGKAGGRAAERGGVASAATGGEGELAAGGSAGSRLPLATCWSFCCWAAGLLTASCWCWHRRLLLPTAVIELNNWDGGGEAAAAADGNQQKRQRGGPWHKNGEGGEMTRGCWLLKCHLLANIRRRASQFWRKPRCSRCRKPNGTGTWECDWGVGRRKHGGMAGWA
jgi:hypothetical protein